jgi:hypothetical protein
MPMHPRPQSSDRYGVAETSGFLPPERTKAMNTAKELEIRRVRRNRAVRVGAAASGLAVVLACAAAAPAVAVPSETRKVHVEGHLLPVEKSPGVYGVTGGLVGTLKLRTERVSYAWTYWTTQIRDIEGTASLKGCIDQNQNQGCDPGEPSGVMRLTFNRVASFDVGTGRLIEGDSAYRVNSSGRFRSGIVTTRDIPVHNIDQIVSTYRADLEVIQPTVGSKRAD